MALFKKRKEKIVITVPEVPVISSKAEDSEIYYERAKPMESKYNLDDCFDDTSKQERIIKSIDAYDKKQTAMFQKYYFLKLFSKAAMRDLKYNEQFLNLDKQVNRIKKNYEELKKRIDLLRFVDDVTDFDLEDLFSKINELFDFYRGLDIELNKFQNTYYRNLKMTSFSICNDKTYTELDQLNKSVSKLIDEYKTIQDAYDFIYYNSGELLVDTINALVQCFENSGNSQYIKDYPFTYFLESDYVVVLKFTEWIELFTKIRYVKRSVNKIELFDYLKFKELYQELEKRYILMLIYNEMNQR